MPASLLSNRAGLTREHVAKRLASKLFTVVVVTPPHHRRCRRIALCLMHNASRVDATARHGVTERTGRGSNP